MLQATVVKRYFYGCQRTLSTSLGRAAAPRAYLQAPFTGLQSEKKFLTLLLSSFGPKKA